MENLKRMKENIVSCIQTQINSNLENVDTKELGEAIDMVKDLSEAIYYCTVTEAMHAPQHHESRYPERLMPQTEYYPSNYGYGDMAPVMYYSNGSRGGNPSYMNYTGGSNGGNGTSYYHGGYDVYPTHPDPYRGSMYEGTSSKYRKMYMEGKVSHGDKAKHMQDLENYMRELGQDITEMIQDASPEEKTMLQQKIQTLATKIR